MWENLKSVVNEVIKPNDNREITGEKHNSTLRTVINSLGKYAQFAGLAFKNTNPGTPDGPVFYFAAFKGVYINFNRIEVEENEVAILNYNNNKWEKIVIGYSPIAPATIEDIRLTTLIDSINESNALKTNFEFKQDSILGVQLPFLHAAVSHIDADGQLIKGKPTSETLILVPLAEASTDADTPGKHGFMSYQDKDLLDSIPNYTISGKKISENPILTYDDIQGVAYLGEDGKIPSSLLPSYVDDVLEYDSIDNFPLIGEGGKIYLDKKTNLAYRWSGTVYVSISSSIALGETSSTAYAGDKGKKNADDIADLKANKADKTSVYTKEEVDYLIEHFKLPDHIKAITFSVDGILVSKNEDGNLVIGGNVIVEGGISMYGPGQFGDTIMDYIVVDGTSIKIIDGKLTVDPNFVGGGTVKGIKVNGHTYDEVDTNGYVTIPDYPTELAWNSITGKPSTFTPSAHTHKIEDITDIANASVSHATTADRLKKEIMIWGQPFDGSTDVEGAISNVDVINMANADTVISLYIKDNVLFIDGDLAVTGGITMYASNGVASGMIDQVYAVLDQSIFSIKDGVITITGEIGGGTVKAVKVGITQYDPDSDGIISLPEYPTVTTLEWDNILNKPSSFIPSAHTHAISEITNLQATLDGKAAASHTHAISDITNISSASVSYATSAGNADTVDGYHAQSGSNTPFGTIPVITTGGWMDVGKQFEFHYDNTTGSDYSTVLRCTGNYANVVNLPSASGTLALVENLSAYLPLTGGTMTGHINLSSANAKIAFGTLTTSPITGYKAPNLASQGVGLYARYGASSDEGAIIITEDTCVIYNSADTGWNFQVMDKDLGTDMTNSATRSFGVNDAHQAWSLAGFVKSGSSDSYVLLGGGGHKAESSLSVNYASSAGSASSATKATNDSDGSQINTTYLKKSGGTMTGALTVKQYIFGYNYNHAGGNALAFVFDKPGSNYTGIGANGENDTIYFSAATISNGEASWVTSYKQKWKFNGTIYQENNAVIHTGNYSSYALPLSGGTINGSLGVAGGLYIGEAIYMQAHDLVFNTNSLIRWNPSTTPAGFTMPGNDCDLLICSRLPDGGDEGGIVVGSDVCVIYNSADEGAILKVIDKDVNSDLSQSYTGSSCYLWVGQDKWCRAKYLYASGDILAGGGITMYSDLRKKNILSNEVLSVKEIAAAPLFRHTYKSDNNQYIHVGTSAQYWSGIHEDWFTRKDSEGYYQMELQNLGVAMGISLAREIVKYESKTDKKIRLMKKRINELEKANESLEARVKELEERRTA